MGPAPKETPNPNANNEAGWYVGYEVEMNGVGVVNVYGELESDSDSDGYVGPDAENNGSRDDSAVHGIYQSIPSSAGEDSDSEDEITVVSQDTDKSSVSAEPSARGLPHFVSPPCQKYFENAMNSAPSVHLTDRDFPIPSNTKDFDLSDENIKQLSRQ